VISKARSRKMAFKHTRVYRISMEEILQFAMLGDADRRRILEDQAAKWEAGRTERETFRAAMAARQGFAEAYDRERTRKRTRTLRLARA
jgi:hypothetical protein